MILAPFVTSLSTTNRLYGAGVTYDNTTGFWETPSGFATDGVSLNVSGLHDYAVFGKLIFIGTPGTYPDGYNPDLFYYAFVYVHYVPNPTSLIAPTDTFRLGLSLTPEDAMNRIPVIFADSGTGNLRFDAKGKFIKLVTTVPECCDLPYFNERNLSLANYQGSFDPEALNYYNTLYDNSVALNSQIDHDKIKKSVSFTISGITRNGVASPTSPAGMDAEIDEVIGWMNATHTLYHHSDSPEISFYNSDTLSKAFHQQQGQNFALLENGSISYHNARVQTGLPDRYLVSRFAVTYGNLIGPFPTYTPDPDKILYRLTVTGQFHYKDSYASPKLFSLVYELKESCTLITLGHLSGTKTLTLVAETDPYINYYISGIPGTIDVAFSGSDYSAEVLPVTLTLVSPEKYLQDPCRMAGPMNGLGSYSYPSGLVAVDGITPVAGDRVYITTSSSFYAQGVWIASAGSWTRPTDWNLKYSYFEILEGTNAGKKYYLTESTGYVFSQFGVFPSEHNWRVNNYTDELPSSITLNKVAGYNNYEAEFTTAVNVRNYIRLKLTALGYGFSFQQWTQEVSYGAGTGYYQPSDALIEYFNESTGLNDGSSLYTAPAEAKMLVSCSGLITIRLFKMAATNNGSNSASENSLTVQYLLDWPLGV